MQSLNQPGSCTEKVFLRATTRRPSNGFSTIWLALAAREYGGRVTGTEILPARAAEAATNLERTGLAAIARGPRSSRASRHTMLRKVVLEHSGQSYNGTIRNISATGALVEGLWNVPVGTIFRIALSDLLRVTATARWCADDRMGVEFAVPLERDASGTLTALAVDPPTPLRREFRRSA